MMIMYGLMVFGLSFVRGWTFFGSTVRLISGDDRS